MTRHNGYLSFTRLRAQFVKEVLSILRDPRSRMVVFMPPLLQLLVFAFAATLEVRNVDIAVHNQDAGRWSHELIARLDRADFITQVYRVTDGQELGRLIDQGKVRQFGLSEPGLQTIRRAHAVQPRHFSGSIS